eukprot:SAG11_NODE_8486_length_1009_cov_8.018681_2_plen_111_part_00
MLPRAGDRVTYVPRNGPPVPVSVVLVAPADDGTIDDITVRFDNGHTTITNIAYLRRLQAEGTAAPGSASPGPSLGGAVAELKNNFFIFLYIYIYIFLTPGSNTNGVTFVF